MQTRYTDGSWRFRSLDYIYHYNSQLPHNYIAIEDHTQSGDISFVKGGIVGIDGNYWNGYCKGTNKRTNEIGLFPCYKTVDQFLTAPPAPCIDRSIHLIPCSYDDCPAWVSIWLPTRIHRGFLDQVASCCFCASTKIEKLETKLTKTNQLVKVAESNIVSLQDSITKPIDMEELTKDVVKPSISRVIMNGKIDDNGISFALDLLVLAM
ncbi:hypothetical protein GJ496_009966 [Pomphorhynchus laevis]|nr:hypothetical protein GJ496_009966 [Pomphorhynchus laevis]